MTRLKIASTVFILLSIFSLGTYCVKVPKCCPEGQKGRNNCTESSDPRLHPFKPFKDFETYTSSINCTTDVFFYDPEDYYYVDQSGYLIHEYEGSEIDRHSPDKYCFDFSGDDLVPFFCVNPESTEKDEEVPTVYAICMIVSTICLVAIAIIYSAYKTLRENSHTPYLVSHTIALALAFACLVRIQLSDNSESIWCKVSGYGVQYFFLAAFFWLNSMSIDIYMTLSEMRPTVRRNAATDRKFLYFSLYSWGFPLLITVGTIIMTHVKTVPYHYRPNVGERKCLLSGKPIRWIYLNGPIALLIAINVTIFILTAIKLLRHRSASASVARNRNTLGDQTRHFFLYLKLFIVMGLSWSTEILSFIFAEDLKSFWFVTDIVNALQGLLIFLLFVCKKNVLNLLLGEFKIFSNYFSSRNQSTRSSKTMTPMTSVVYTDDHN